MPTSWAEDHVWFRTPAGIGPADAWPSVTMNAGLLDEWKIPPGLVLLSGEGHFWIALDYRGRAPEDEPSVVWLQSPDGACRARRVGFDVLRLLGRRGADLDRRTASGCRHGPSVPGLPSTHGGVEGSTRARLVSGLIRGDSGREQPPEERPVPLQRDA